MNKKLKKNIRFKIVKKKKIENYREKGIIVKNENENEKN